MNQENRKRTIIITGAGTGIGRGCALELAPGNRLILHYNSSEAPAREVADAVGERGGEAVLVQADLSGDEGCERFLAKVSAEASSVDVLVNNAGSMVQRHAVGEITWKLMEDIFALNAFSALRLSALFLPLLSKGTDPSIIFMTSIGVRHGNPTAVLYGAAKGALDTVTRGMAAELAGRIRVNAVAPGVIETPFHERFSTPERLAGLREKTPVGRNGTPEDVARAVRFLVESSFVTGETVDVNGGLFMR